MNNDWTTLLDHQWIISTLEPVITPTNPPLILLHGLSGDENSVKPLTFNIKRNRWMISLRGILPAADQGYAWAPAKTRDQAGFMPSVIAFEQEWTNIQSILGITSDEVDLLGFSQGAAFSSLLMLNYPNWVRRAALVSGFIPSLEPSFPLPSLASHKVLISHGTEDEVIPIADAQRSSDFLLSLGADVVFCKSNTRHKISAHCLEQLESFFD
ncbi:hypothetical protein EG832_20530 [bacterium]|nr:hypothetical protein [bacterium]